MVDGMAYKLLFVDDEDVIRQGFENFIKWETLGFELVACLKDGDEAIKYLETNDVDVILTDIVMPKVSGLELARYLLDHKTHVKVAIISGHLQFDYAKQAINLGVSSFITKPADVNEVAAAFGKIKAQLDRERQEKQHLSKEHDHYHTIMPILKDQFFKWGNRRFLGDYMLVKRDLLEARRFEDAVA